MSIHIVVQNNKIINRISGFVNYNDPTISVMEEKYPTDIGYVYNEEIKAFVHPDYTFEHHRERVNFFINNFLEQKEKYENMASLNPPEVIMNQITEWLDYVNETIQKLNSNEFIQLDFKLDPNIVVPTSILNEV